MSKIGIFYGSTTGNTQTVAEKINKELAGKEVNTIDVSSSNAGELKDYDLLILGSSTWGIGDLQDDWESFINELKSSEIEEKNVAIFGCGDSGMYPDSFCDAIGTIYTIVNDKNCKVVGFVDKDDYSYSDSTAVIDNSFVGLPVDDSMNENETNENIKNWVAQVLKECKL